MMNRVVGMSHQEYALPVMEGGVPNFGGGLWFLSQKKTTDVIQMQYSQLNFVLCQVFALLFSIPFRALFGPDKCATHTRHVLEIFVGTIMAMFCFGTQAFHLIGQTIGAYAIMSNFQSRSASRLVFIYAMGYLWFTHAYRLYYDYGGYILDITGPLMINTQRVTSVAFGYRDGNRELNKNTDSLIRKHSLKVLPPALDFMSYNLSFHTLMCGPFVFFQDYKSFIEGTNLPAVLKRSDRSAQMQAVVTKLVQSCVCLGLFLFVGPIWDPGYMFEPAFFRQGFLEMNMYIVMATTMARMKYYFAWKMAEAVNVNCGLGYNRNNDPKSTQKWDLADNGNILSVELSTSLKTLIDNWNTTTTVWLRYVVYGRYKSMFLVFFLSAVWHGFYPGYYLTFFTGAVFTSAARLFRANVRERFQKTATSRQIYDTFTFLACRLAVAYLTFPFVLLQFTPSFKIYKELFFYGHVVAGAIIAGYSAKALMNKKPKPHVVDRYGDRIAAKREPYSEKMHGETIPVKREMFGEKITAGRYEKRAFGDGSLENDSTSSGSAGSSVDIGSLAGNSSATSFVF